MGSSFFEINIAMSGLFAAQKGLAVTGNNISNASTAGYSRQVLDQKASRPLSGMGTGMIGTGVETTQIRRIRDSYIDQKLWGHNDTLGEYKIKSEQNTIVESVFGEPSDVGFTTLFNDIFNAIDDLGKTPTGGENKEALRQTLISFTKYFNTASETLSDYQRNLNFELSAAVKEINNLAESIQSLNKEIFQYEMHGDIANTLRDERELCIDRLSQLANIEAKEVEIVKEDGSTELQFKVSLNGQTLVDHFHSNKLELQMRDEKINGQDVGGLYDVQWSNGLTFDLHDPDLSGELKGLVDMRDGAGVDGDVHYKGIPYYIGKLDEFATKFAEEMNKVYNQEMDADGNITSPALMGGDTDGDGVPEEVLFGGLKVQKHMLFGATQNGNAAPDDLADIERLLKKDADGNYMDEDGDGFADLDIKASEFSVSASVYEDSSNIRTNFEHDPTTGDNPNESSNDLLLELLGQKDNINMFSEGNPKDFMISMFSELGINTKEAKMYQTSQTNIVKVVENQRLSVSQVDTNEEFMNMIQYNQAYQVAAKLINTMDSIYETTIFKLGNW